MSKKLPVYFAQTVCFWLAFFAFGRLLFLGYHFDKFQSIDFSDIAKSFAYSIKLDLSTIGYIMLFSYLCYTLAAWIKSKWWAKCNYYYHIILIAISSAVIISELEIYEQWNNKLSSKAISFLIHPLEALQSTRPIFLLIGGCFWVIWLGVSTMIFRKIPFYQFILTERNKVFSLAFPLITPILLILGIRGGWQPIPIQQGEVYFSKHNIVNLLTVNSVWNLGQSIHANQIALKRNPYQYYPKQAAAEIVQKAYQCEKDTSPSILTQTRPNVVFVIFEGISADVVQSMGGLAGVMPNLDTLMQKSVVFDSIYASGMLSDQGMAAIWSAFPAQPSTSIINHITKYASLPCLISPFKKAGYHTSFLFGGQLIYGNIKSYIYYNQFDEIKEEVDFNPSLHRGALGIPDALMYEEWLNRINQYPTPFFTSMFTLSSHSPYDMPMEEVIHSGETHKPYLNSCYYADKSLAAFMKNAAKQKWFDNTLFVFISDHGHPSPRNWNPVSPESRKIPMILYGNVLKPEWKGKVIHTVGSQIDLAATLLPQFEFSAKDFHWSKNLLNPYSPQFAYYATFYGAGWVRSHTHYVYKHLDNNTDLLKKDETYTKEQLEKEAKSYLQTLFEEYTSF